MEWEAEDADLSLTANPSFVAGLALGLLNTNPRSMVLAAGWKGQPPGAGVLHTCLVALVGGKGG